MSDSQFEISRILDTAPDGGQVDATADGNELIINNTDLVSIAFEGGADRLENNGLIRRDTTNEPAVLLTSGDLSIVNVALIENGDGINPTVNGVITYSSTGEELGINSAILSTSPGASVTLENTGENAVIIGERFGFLHAENTQVFADNLVTVDNSGTIKGGIAGVEVRGSSTLITNTGLITGNAFSSLSSTAVNLTFGEELGQGSTSVGGFLSVPNVLRDAGDLTDGEIETLYDSFSAVVINEFTGSIIGNGAADGSAISVAVPNFSLVNSGVVHGNAPIRVVSGGSLSIINTETGEISEADRTRVISENTLSFLEQGGRISPQPVAIRIEEYRFASLRYTEAPDITNDGIIENEGHAIHSDVGITLTNQSGGSIVSRTETDMFFAVLGTRAEDFSITTSRFFSRIDFIEELTGRSFEGEFDPIENFPWLSLSTSIDGIGSAIPVNFVEDPMTGLMVADVDENGDYVYDLPSLDGFFTLTETGERITITQTGPENFAFRFVDGDLAGGTAFVVADDIVQAADDIIVNEGFIGDGIHLGLGNDSLDSSSGLLSGEVMGGAGNDTIRLGASDDFAEGGSGRDLIRGGRGADTLLGGYGDDDIVGGSGADSLSGDSGNDKLGGASGADTLMGGDGGDAIRGGLAGDIIEGGAGGDNLLGGLGADTINGGDNNDSIGASGGADIVDGGSGNDTIRGGAGSDQITGGSGNDTLIGGGGADRFVFMAGHDSDIITDFDVTADSLDLSVLAGFTSIELVLAAATVTESGILITTQSGTIALQGVTSLDALTSAIIEI